MAFVDFPNFEDVYGRAMVHRDPSHCQTYITYGRLLLRVDDSVIFKGGDLHISQYHVRSGISEYRVPTFDNCAVKEECCSSKEEEVYDKDICTPDSVEKDSVIKKPKARSTLCSENLWK